MRQLKNAVVTCVSVGWLLPAAFGVKFVITAVRRLEAPHPIADSFPYAKAAQDMFMVAGVWLLVVILGWLWNALWRRREIDRSRS